MAEESASLDSLKRHTRVWLDQAQPISAVHLLSDEARPMVEAHTKNGYAFVARRTLPTDSPGYVPLGLRLPRESIVRSVSFPVAPSAIATLADPIMLADLLTGTTLLPQAWRNVLLALQQEASKIGTTIYVYGSVAWQAITGTRYIAVDSDIDLLIRPQSAEHAHRCLTMLQAAENNSAVRLDGELEFPGGRAVAWKELLTKSHRLLVKTNSSVGLITREALWNHSIWV